MRSGPDLLADCRECVIAYRPENGSREFVFIPAGTSHQMSPASGMRLPMRRCHTELSHYVFGVGRGGRCRESFRSFSQAAWETTSTLIVKRTTRASLELDFWKPSMAQCSLDGSS
jgi:hypothetical protein